MNNTEIDQCGLDPHREDHAAVSGNMDTPPLYKTVNQWMARGVVDAELRHALIFNDRVVSHCELDALSNRIANHLIRKGVRPGDCVGMCLERSIEMVAVLMGILKAGAAYVPLDPSYPSERLAMMEEDARLRCLVVHSIHAGLFEHRTEGLHVWDEIATEVETEPSTPAAVNVDPEDLAYVIFTSGSTGRPKGVAMPHRALANLIEWQLERTTFKPMARVLQYSSISFDVSFQEIATTIASGGTLHLITNADRKDPRKLLRQLIDHQIERLFLPYVAMRSMIEAALVIETFPETLAEIITAGEQLRVDDTVRSFFKRIERSSLDNQYGPSETHVITAHLLEENPDDWPDLPPIGMPLKNTGTYILDEDMQPVDVGEPGELYLAGRNLAHGYIHREEITQRVFIPNPFEQPNHPYLYKTGDLATYNQDGTIDFLGRIDHQIKIRGHRIEPGEINNAAASFPNMGHCLTHAVAGPNHMVQLATYFTAKGGASIDVAQLRQHLADKLPEYMVPSFLIGLEDIPYTPSGKVDLKSLPKPSISNSQYADEVVHYESDTEAGLADIWSELLGMNGIPRSADFFELGGDSLRAVTLFLRIQQRFDKDLPLSSLAQAPTISTLARLIDGDSDFPDLNGCRSLQLIQRGEDGIAPFFLIHGGAGNVLVFNDFARNLDPQQPVYGFQWSGWDGRPGDNRIMEMAHAYKKELTRFHPAKSYRLGGNCIGGLIAIELAKLLKQDGIEIEGPLIVWDAPNLQSNTYRRDEPWGRADQMEIFEHLKVDLLDRTEGLGAATTIVAGPEAEAGRVMEILKRIPLLRGVVQWAKGQSKAIPVYRALLKGEKVPVALRPSFCRKSMVVAVKKHANSVYPGDMLYFRSHCVLGRGIGLTGWWNDNFFGFSELCGGRFEAHVVGGGHNDVLGFPRVGEVVSNVFKKKHESA